LHRSFVGVVARNAMPWQSAVRDGEVGYLGEVAVFKESIRAFLKRLGCDA